MSIRSLSLRARAAASSLIAVAGLLPVASAWSAGAPATEPPSLQRAVDYLISSQQPSGSFAYGFDFLADGSLEPFDIPPVQITRQAGTAAILGETLRLSRDPRVAASVARLIEQLGTRSLPIGRNRLQSFIAWTRIQSMPVGHWRIQSALKRYGLLYETTGPGLLVSPDSSYAHAYAGATALALLAELRYARATGDQRFASLRRGWLEGVIALHMPGEGFRVIPDLIETNAYFDGEPWLALAEYHRAFPDDARARAVLEDMDAVLLPKYRANFSFDFYQWGTMAAAVRYADTHDRRFLDFMRAQLAELLRRRAREPVGDNNCDLVEGVAETMGALDSTGERGTDLYRRAFAWTRAEMQKAAIMQIRPGQTELVFPAARIEAPKMQEFSGAFRNGLYTAATRVDTTAHCVLAMAKLQQHGIVFGP